MNIDFDEIYRNVPSTQKEHVRKFRSTHPYTALTTDGVTWEYISCGQGEETLVLLPGGSFRLGETWFHLITTFESHYKIIAPTYPPVPIMEQRVKAISHILKSETIDTAHVLGWSLGGWTAQCFIREHPDTVKTLILSNTSGPSISKTSLSMSPTIISTYPTRLLQFGINKLLQSLLAVPDSEQELWKAFTREISLRTTKEDIINERKCMFDYVSNYVFSADDLVDWPGKILIIESDDDSTFDECARDELKALYPAAQVHTFHNGGHSPAYNKPEGYISVVQKFLKEL